MISIVLTTNMAAVKTIYTSYKHTLKGSPLFVGRKMLGH